VAMPTPTRRHGPARGAVAGADGADGANWPKPGGVSRSRAAHTFDFRHSGSPTGGPESFCLCDDVASPSRVL
jgi:hypothetical protein